MILCYYCNRCEERNRISKRYINRDVEMLPFWFGLLLWFLLCVICITVISAFFSGVKRAKHSHQCTCQLDSWDGLNQKAALTGKMPFVDTDVDNRLPVYLNLLLWIPTVIKWWESSGDKWLLLVVQEQLQNLRISSCSHFHKTEISLSRCAQKINEMIGAVSDGNDLEVSEFY